MIVSVKDACLLAMDTFNKLAKHAYSRDPKIILLTPLAGAVFAKSDIPELASALELSVPDTLAVINSSAQTGGHWLNESTMDCAIACCLVAIKGIKDEKIRTSIFRKIVKQYIAKGKKFTDIKFGIYDRFARGGVPAELTYSKLLEAFESAQKVKLSRRTDS